MFKTKLVLIEWFDSSQPVSNWVHLDDLPKAKPIKCASVGWLLVDTKHVKVLAPNMGDIKSTSNAQASGLMTIPACSVTKITRLIELKAISSTG